MMASARKFLYSGVSRDFFVTPAKLSVCLMTVTFVVTFDGFTEGAGDEFGPMPVEGIAWP
jgi:hypothetical protein